MPPVKKNKKTILYADQAVSFGGSIVVLGSLVSAIDKKKFRPIVVGEMSESILNYHMQGNADIYVMPRIFKYTHWFKVIRIANRIHPLVFKKIFIYLMSGIKSLFNTVYIIRLINIILKEKVDIVHVNNGMSNLEPIIAAIVTGRKYVVHFHGVEKPGLVQRLLINRVHKYIVISRFLADALSENGFPRERMIVVPNPYQKSHALGKELEENDKDREELRARYNLEQGDKVFAIVGRLVRWKGHIEFLNAAFIALESVPQAKALIIGDCSDGNIDYQNQIQKMVEDSEFSDRITMTGYVKDVSSLYAIMDVCVHTSIEPEPFGLVIIEAMANRVPVIASDLGAPKEIITDGANGYIVSPVQAQLLADKITQLLTDEKQREKMGESARLHVQEHYNDKNYAQTIENIYSDLLTP